MSFAALAHAAEPATRIVSVGGSVTEILYALGAADRIAAVDTTSTYPADAAAKPDVGYMRALSAEGVLSVAPDLILAQQGAGPPDALAVLQASGIAYVAVPDEPSPTGVAAKIKAVGEAVGARPAADVLAADVVAAFDGLAEETRTIPERKRVLFVLSLANGRITAAGRDTSAAAMIALAGGINAADGFTGFKPMVDEAVIAAAPDVVLVMPRGEHATTADAVFALPAFQSTPAAANRALLSMDGLALLGFGPRAPAAARDLAAALYPGRISPATAP
nr:ABC transporter substrate-binding protein [Chthonobacter albigriseus]